MSDTLINACNALEALSASILGGSADDRTFLEWYGWNCPPMTRHELAALATNSASRLREMSPKQIEGELEAKLSLVPAKLQLVQANTLPQLYSGNATTAIPVIVTVIQWIDSFAAPYLPPIVDWQDISEQELMPKALLRRLRSVDTQITNLEGKSLDLAGYIDVIKDAHATAESLPTDLASLEEARSAVARITRDATKANTSAETSASEASESVKRIEAFEAEADALVKNCESAFSAATTKGLGEAFALRAKGLASSMWVWVGGLLVALATGAFLSHERISVIQALMRTAAPNISLIWTNVALALLSIAAPTWFAWLATKQIGQRFRLAEDYAFKASVAQAYAGYNREAARIDPTFAARLFGLALDRIDEAPLRFVETENHGSPLHELIKAFGNKASRSKLNGEIAPTTKIEKAEIE